MMAQLTLAQLILSKSKTTLLAKMEAQVYTLCILTQPKEDNNKFKNKKKPQNCQKIKLYGNPLIRELKKKHPSRPIGGAETGSLSKPYWKPGEGEVAAGGLGVAAGRLGSPTFVFG